MKSRRWMCIAVVSLFAVLTMTVSLTAQTQDNPASPPKYFALPLGTLGGPSSNVSAYAQILSSNEAMVGGADTGDLDPNFPNQNGLLGENVFIAHAAITLHSIKTDLGALPGGHNSFPLWINAASTVAGLSEDGSIDPLLGVPAAVAVMWKNGQIVNLGTLGGYESVAISVNNSDVVAGSAANNIPDPNSFFGWGTQTRGFIYQNGMMTDLGTLGGDDTLAALINDAGQITGFSIRADGVIDPFIWAKGKMTDMGGLGGTFGAPNDINSKGQVVGVSNLAGDRYQHGFFWDGTMMHDLGSLSNAFNTDYSEAIWMNEAGDIVGRSNLPGLKHHAVLWKNAGPITDLGTLPGDNCSVAWGVNNKGQIVGTSGTCGAVQNLHAVLWQDGQIYDLSNVFYNAVMTAGFNINDRGEIAAVGSVNTGGDGPQIYTNTQRAFLLVPFGGGSKDKLESPENIGPRRGRFGNQLHLPGRFAPPVE